MISIPAYLKVCLFHIRGYINKCPVYARNNKSNLDLITHNKGFIFKNNQENILLNKNTDNI